MKEEKRAKEKHLYLRDRHLLHKYFLNVHCVPGTGLWVIVEQPEETSWTQKKRTWKMWEDPTPKDEEAKKEG